MQSISFYDFMLIIILVTYLLGLRWPLANIVRDFVLYYALVIHTLLKRNNCCPSFESLVAFQDYVKAILKVFSWKNKDADESKNLGEEQANQNNNATNPPSDSSEKKGFKDLAEGYQKKNILILKICF